MKIGITNLKGGVGKTTLTINLAVCLAHFKYSVCIVDTDENQNSLAWAGSRDEDLPTILTVGVTDAKALTKQVDELNKRYDFVLIDGTPKLDEMTTRIILASDVLLIPLIASSHDFLTIRKFLTRYEQAKEFKADIHAFFFLNQFQGYSVQNSIKEVLGEFEVRLLDAMYKSRVAYVEAAVEGRGVLEWTDEKAATEAVEMATEIVEIVKSLKK